MNTPYVDGPIVIVKCRLCQAELQDGSEVGRHMIPETCIQELGRWRMDVEDQIKEIRYRLAQERR
jgi:hypothetical protein